MNKTQEGFEKKWKEIIDLRTKIDENAIKIRRLFLLGEVNFEDIGQSLSEWNEDNYFIFRNVVGKTFLPEYKIIKEIMAEKRASG